MTLRPSRPSPGSCSAVWVIHTLVRDAADIENVPYKTFAREPNAGLILPPDNTTTRYRELIIAFAASHRLPAVYSDLSVGRAGGLMFYGADFADVFRRANLDISIASCAAKNRAISPSRRQRNSLVINLKTATALGIEMPPMLLARATR